jgi:tetratricopeptide (TPR) repeat protein
MVRPFSRLILSGALLGATGLAAQEPPRPALAAGVDTNSWEGYFDLGVKAFRKLPEDAEAAFYWASRLDPSRAEPYFGRWAIIIQRSKRDDIRGYFRGVEATMRLPRIQEADSLRLLALVRNPFVHRGLEVVIFDELPGGFAEDRDTRAWIAYANGEFAKAVQLLTMSIDRGGRRSLWLRYDRATANVMAGNLPAALEDLTTLVAELRKGDDKEMVTFYRSKHLLLYMIGMLQRELRNPTAARAAFGEAMVEDAAFAYGSAGLATLSRAQRQNTTAASELAWAVEIAPNDGQLRFQYAQVLVDLKQYEAAAEQLTLAQRLEPWYAAPVLLMGRVREAQGREAEAFAAYERYVALAPARDSQRSALRIRLEQRARQSP